HSRFSMIHSSRSIDTWSYHKNHIRNIEFAPDGIQFQYSLYACARFFVELFQSVVGKYTILAYNGYNICSNAYSCQINQVEHFLFRLRPAFGKCLQQFKTYTTT